MDMKVNCFQGITHSLREEGDCVYSIMRNDSMIGFCKFNSENLVSIPTPIPIEELPVVSILLGKIKK